ncbi:MAG: UDP-N-acetylmuramoyl-tripeptide--D-alanyl-D-alanine ligase [Xanthomonadales bacterium]|nr:UDP-N-acetylmuramoyl-tripeptide--D-alanyl-D-alanine ligase [Xanthomonadales bacterium]
MLSARLSELALWLGGRLAGADAVVNGVGHDTRTLRPGMLYVALRGERVDGHALLPQAAAAGAAGALVATADAGMPLPQLVVADPLLALGELARRHRERMPARVVGITGSNGKTTVKTLVAAILSRVGRCHANPGNRNNEVGLPLAVLELDAGHDYAVFEMGAGKPGDIAYLAAIAQPAIGLVNNVGPAHLERLGSLDGVAETKGALYAALPAEGVAVINADDAYASRFERQVASRRLLRFGLQNDADVGADAIELGERCRFRLRCPAGEGEVELPLPGRHNLMNALAAAAIACALEVPFAAIRDGLAAASGVAGRLRLLRQPGGHALVDDTYNANPASVAAAIDTLAGLPGEHWLVLGDMGELGADAPSLHAQIGRHARQAGLARLDTVGELSREASAAFGAGGRHHETLEALVASLQAALHAGVVCLVKGSRSAGMERVVAALRGDSDAA